MAPLTGLLCRAEFGNVVMIYQLILHHVAGARDNNHKMVRISLREGRFLTPI